MIDKNKENNILPKLKDFEEAHPDCLYFLNLTDGLESIASFDELEIPEGRRRFLMIQSSHLEQKSIDAIMSRLGSDLLMELALNRTCVVVDYGTDKEISRAIYQGVPFIRYVLEAAWFDYVPEKTVIYPRRSDADPRDVTELYAKWWKNLDRRIKSHIRKFGKYARACREEGNHNVPLYGISTSTEHDGHPEYYVELVEKLYKTRRNK